MLQKNRKIAQSIKEKIDVYHTCAIQKEATIAFGIKPAFLQEVYQRLTADASKSRASDEAEADIHICLVLDCEDPGIVCDLRELNEGRPEKYTKLWRNAKNTLNM